jgi:hypothetical protein
MKKYKIDQVRFARRDNVTGEYTKVEDDPLDAVMFPSPSPAEGEGEGEVIELPTAFTARFVFRPLSVASRRMVARMQQLKQTWESWRYRWRSN